MPERYRFFKTCQQMFMKLLLSLRLPKHSRFFMFVGYSLSNVMFLALSNELCLKKIKKNWFSCQKRHTRKLEFAHMR